MPTSEDAGGGTGPVIPGGAAVGCTGPVIPAAGAAGGCTGTETPAGDAGGAGTAGTAAPGAAWDWLFIVAAVPAGGELKLIVTSP